MKLRVTLFVFLVAGIALGQNKTLTLEDATLGYMKGLYPQQIWSLQWTDADHVYAMVQDNNLRYTDAASGKVVQTLTLEDFQKRYPNAKYFPGFSFVGTERLVFEDGNTINEYHPKTGAQSTFAYPEDAANAEYSSKANAVAYTLGNNLYVATKENPQWVVTSNEDGNVVSGQAIARSEYGITKGTFWSPNGNFLAFYVKDESEVTDYPLVDITTYPASEKTIKYPMAGQGSEVPSVGIYNMKTHQTTYLNIDTKDHHYLTNLTWTPDEQYVLIAELNRATTRYELNRYSVQTGQKGNTILTEENPIWVEPEHDAVFIPGKSDAFLWFSEQDGFMNLYWYTTDGKRVKQLTSFNWVVEDILGFDKEAKNVIITGTGPDAREAHAYKVNLKNGKFTLLNPEPGSHTSQLSGDGDYLIDVYSSLTIPGITQIVSIKDGKSSTLLKSPNPLADYRMGTQEFVDLRAEDGTLLHGILMKPANFDPSKKYPVLVYVYGGPHAQLVTNSFLGGASMWLPAFATLNDYIVFTLDNRGSARRGFAFESGIHKQLGELEMKDQMVGVSYLQSLPYVDSSQMAVNGWSFGGFMASSLMLRHPGTFTTAVAGGPVIDWKYYEVMYGERYMDTPQENPEGYERARVSKYITNLQGNLMVVIGSVDPVVVPQHAMSLLKAAIDNNIQMDFFTYPMHEHNVRGKDRVNLIEKMAAYIVQHNK
ncbi:MAG TPA: DPP IV N-terminal domain-containing protein [Flavobacteriaceae bacterium]|nr:DPP IV N-terminal domain-containing protein [Flavobacteriaceae bacterium]MCB9213457.1 DPP IV N-terminal domain-containing protein [Alteromonas sp.]HPF12240.1 DPP IV N-terminal domain-containing protein [Flavobacteriaceae bacterium]HQU22475.1 DPP IV N-terminal domain-containing protein [Flavobacteriaceae bacterium]HQU65872.1 DPP IV N-terminal domain-containing protein [Flavobacteriaceae bacterium]